MSDTDVYPGPRDLQHPYEPSKSYTEGLVDRPIRKMKLWNDRDTWVVVGHPEGRSLLEDNRLSARPDIDGYPHVSPALAGYRKHGLETFNNKDNPQHNIERRMFTKFFTVRRIQSLRPRIQALVEKRLEEFIVLGPGSDLVEHFALPIPSEVIFELLNAPYEDHEVVEKSTNAMLSWRSTTEESQAASQELLEYAERLIGERQANPIEGDVISEAIRDHVETGNCTMTQLAMGIRLMFLAGHETTANAISVTSLVLMENPEVRQKFVELEDPKEITAAVEELLRYVTVAQAGRCRVALEDVEIGDMLIQQGDGVVISSEGANRDPRVFDEPSVLMLDRPNTKDLASFGFGTHRCIGEVLVKLEMEIVLQTLFRRLPDLRPAVPRDKLNFKTDHTIYGLYEFPVEWGESA